VNRGGSQKNYREGSRQLPDFRLPELASWYERVAVPSVLVRSHRCSRTPPRPHGSINNNEKEEEPHGIDPAKPGLVAANTTPRATTRSVFRWIHLVFSIPILGYIYSPFDQIPNYAPATRFVFVPVLVLSGLWMWKGHVVRRLLSKRSA